MKGVPVWFFCPSGSQGSYVEENASVENFERKLESIGIILKLVAWDSRKCMLPFY